MSVYVYHPSGISSLFIIMLHKLQINKMFHRSISKLFLTVVRESSTVCCPYMTRELWKCLDMSYWMIKVSVIPFVSLLSNQEWRVSADVQSVAVHGVCELQE